MPKPLSTYLGDRIIAFVNAGRSRRTAARHFDVSPSCVVKIMASLPGLFYYLRKIGYSP